MTHTPVPDGSLRIDSRIATHLDGSADDRISDRAEHSPVGRTRRHSGHHVAIAQARIDSPLGGVTLAASSQGLVGLWFDGQKDHPGTLPWPLAPEQPWISLAMRELQAYWQGDLPRFSVPLHLQGTPFQQAVWQALLSLSSGAVCSYRDIAERIGRPTATRAVGAAVGRNPVSVIVPCHRVIGRDGSLTGYAGGLPRKIALLRLEGRADLLAEPVA